jgi:hypothetical protein
VGTTEAVPFSVFSEAQLNFFNRKGEANFRYALGNAGSSHVEQYVYCYFITPSSRLGKTWNVRGVPVGNFPTVYDKKIAIHNIEWKFSRATPGEIDLLLVYVSGNGHIARSEIVCDFKAKREEVLVALKPLASAAKKFGIPKDGIPIFHVYTEEETQKTGGVKSSMFAESDKYFRVLGLVPTSNIGLVKAAYRELTKQNHPDTNTGISQERMKEINEAYEHIISTIQKMDNRH